MIQVVAVHHHFGQIWCWSDGGDDASIVVVPGDMATHMNREHELTNGPQ